MRSDELRERPRLPYGHGETIDPRSHAYETMTVSEFKATCLKVLEQIRSTGRPLLITKRGMPLATVLPPPPEKPPGVEVFGCMAGTCEEVGDILAPLDEEDWEVLR